MEIILNYQELFRNKLVMIIGMGRSGTTILGQLMGSMKPVYYLYEPQIFNLMLPFFMQDTPIRFSRQALLGSLFEDYYLPIIGAERVYTNKAHPMYSPYYWAGSKTQRIFRRRALASRHRACLHIKGEQPLFVAKVIDMQVFADAIRIMVPTVRFIHIIRNGLYVIESALRQGFYDDAVLTESAKWHQVDPSTVKPTIPACVEDGSRELWRKWKPVTRIAHMWRVLTSQLPGIHYEQLIENPEYFARLLYSEYGLEPTKLTQYHIRRIKGYGSPTKGKLTLKHIESPEREKFAEAMNRFGYGDI